MNAAAQPDPQITDAEAAAVMVMLMDDAQAARILALMDPHELRLLGEKMCALGEIGRDRGVVPDVVHERVEVDPAGVGFAGARGEGAEVVAARRQERVGHHGDDLIRRDRAAESVAHRIRSGHDNRHPGRPAGD